MTTRTISDADIAALVAVRSEVADAHAHPSNRSRAEREALELERCEYCPACHFSSCTWWPTEQVWSCPRCTRQWTPAQMGDAIVSRRFPTPDVPRSPAEWQPPKDFPTACVGHHHVFTAGPGWTRQTCICGATEATFEPRTGKLEIHDVARDRTEREKGAALLAELRDGQHDRELVGALVNASAVAAACEAMGHVYELGAPRCKCGMTPAPGS